MENTVDYFYGDALRWSFGFENPNKAAVIFACLFPICWLMWSLGWKIRSPLLKYGALGGISGLLLLDCLCLFKTYSRGGFVSILVALLYLFWINLRRDSGWWKKILSLKSIWGAGLGLMGIALFIWVGLAERTLDPLAHEDESVGHRLTLWRGALEMAVENPWGFGTGQSGEAYVQWYQPLEMSSDYRTMVSSYLTFLVEQGWLAAFLVLFVFLGFWFWTLPPQKLGVVFEIITSLRAAVLTFLVTGIFTTVMEEPILWILPSLFIIALLGMSIRLYVWPSGKGIIAAILTCSGVLAGLYGGGIWQKSLDPGSRLFGTLQNLNRVIEFKPEKNKGSNTWGIISDEKILGDHYGKLLRKLASNAQITIRLLDYKKPLPAGIKYLVMGDWVQDTTVPADQPVILLYPALITEQKAAVWLKGADTLALILPGLDEDGRARFWQNCALNSQLGPQAITKLEGVGLRIDWGWNEVISKVKTMNLKP